MSNPLPQRIQHLYVIRNMKRSYRITKSKKKKRKENFGGVPSDFSKEDSDQDFWGPYQTFFFFFNGVLAADHSENQKDLLMNLHYSHTQGRFEPL